MFLKKKKKGTQYVGGNVIVREPYNNNAILLYLLRTHSRFSTIRINREMWSFEEENFWMVELIFLKVS